VYATCASDVNVVNTRKIGTSAARTKAQKSARDVLDTNSRSGSSRSTRSGSVAIAGRGFRTLSYTLLRLCRYALSLTATTRSGGTTEYTYSSIDQNCDTTRRTGRAIPTENPSLSAACRGYSDDPV